MPNSPKSCFLRIWKEEIYQFRNVVMEHISNIGHAAAWLFSIPVRKIFEQRCELAEKEVSLTNALRSTMDRVFHDVQKPYHQFELVLNTLRRAQGAEDMKKGIDRFLPIVSGHLTAVSRMLLDLTYINNIWDATALSKSMTFASGESGHFVRLTILNTGSSVAEDQQDAVFTKFYTRSSTIHLNRGDFLPAGTKVLARDCGGESCYVWAYKHDPKQNLWERWSEGPRLLVETEMRQIPRMALRPKRLHSHTLCLSCSFSSTAPCPSWTSNPAIGMHRKIILPHTPQRIDKA